MLLEERRDFFFRHAALGYADDEVVKLVFRCIQPLSVESEECVRARESTSFVAVDERMIAANPV